MPFPWAWLDERPLICGCLGTLQNRRVEVFRCFAEACHDLPVQLVLSHTGDLGSADSADLSRMAVVVEHAPVHELLGRASLTLTHGGLNTVLDSLSYGVPLIAIPITGEQPGVAERIRRTGCGRVLPLRSLNSTWLRDTIRQVLADAEYYRCAAEMQQSIREAGGAALVARIVDGVVTRGKARATTA